jgi:hypothetical protein
MQAQAAESSGFVGGFSCFWKRFILKQLVSIQTFENGLKDRRETSVFELSSAHNYLRIFDLGQELGIRPWVRPIGTAGSEIRPYLP